MRNDILDKKEDILSWINESQSKAFICKELRCKPETLNWWLNKMGIDYKGNQGGKGIKIDAERRKSAIEYAQSTCVKSLKLKIKLIEDGHKEHKCEKCKLSEWLGTPIPIELHHIDGDHYNNDFDNLEILCPNCHTLTDNNSGKNKGKYN
jgi:Zn finger protein HypA/HybF involved in hydrogenase expression